MSQFQKPKEGRMKLIMSSVAVLVGSVLSVGVAAQSGDTMPPGHFAGKSLKMVAVTCS